jgi:hypothetical protein
MSACALFTLEDIGKAAKMHLGKDIKSQDEADEILGQIVEENSPLSSKQKDNILDELVKPFFV